MNIQHDIGREVNALARMPLFKGFNNDELVELFGLSKAEIREYHKDEILHLQNEACRAMEIILEGKVTIQNIDENGNVLTINAFAAGDIIGANLIFSSRNVYPMTVTASVHTTTMALGKELILALCSRSVQFMQGLLREISDKTIILTEKINAISRKTIRQCILDFLNHELYSQGSNVIKLELSKKELAERFGIPRSSLGRELNKMRNEGLVEYDAWTITLKKK